MDEFSKNKNDAVNPNGGPTSDPQAINGHGALRFAYGVALTMADAASLQFGTDQLTITAVAKVASGTPYFFAKVTTTFSGGGGAVYQSGLQFYATAQVTDAGAPVIGPVADVDSQLGDEISWDQPCFEDGKFHIVSLRRTNGSELALTVDDGAPLTASIGQMDVSQPGIAAAVGSLVYGNFRPTTDFELAEILVEHATVIADADVANVHAYLKQKYGL